MRRWPTGQRSNQEDLEPQIGLEPTTCALRDRSTDSRVVVVTRSLVRASWNGPSGTRGTQLVGQSWDRWARFPCLRARLERPSARNSPQTVGGQAITKGTSPVVAMVLNQLSE
jgi:hypothetical protein